MEYILHIDGDAFFVGCELTRRPDLRGRPVVTGAERGIASAVSYEAKALGVVRTMPIFEIRKICPEVVVLSSDYELYSLMSKRMYEIVRRFACKVEEYSIDECFASISFEDDARAEDLLALARKIRDTLSEELGMTFSVGMASTKTLAKVASKAEKPNGAVLINKKNIKEHLRGLAVEKVWGIGEANRAKLERLGINTALEFQNKERAWVENNFYKPQQETWHELNGVYVLPVQTVVDVPKSIQKTKTFTPSSMERSFLWSELSKNVENACIKARRHGMEAGRILFFLKTQDFRYSSFEMRLQSKSARAQEILSAISPLFAQVYRQNVLYRATGITMSDLAPVEAGQVGLFDEAQKSRNNRLTKAVDAIDRKYGKHSVFLASSMQKENTSKSARKKEDGIPSEYLFFGETARRHLRLPHLGIVS